MLYALSLAYAAAGFLIWDRVVARSSDPTVAHLARVERQGGVSGAEDAAFVLAKATFVLSWAPWLAVFAACQGYRWTRTR